MALEKTIEIDGRPVKFRASASTPRLYRNQFGRDIYRDIAALSEDLSQNGAPDNQSPSTMSINSLEIFENVAYIMAGQADPDIPDIDTWLDGFQMFSIYAVMSELIELWAANNKTTETAKKKAGQQPAK